MKKIVSIIIILICLISVIRSAQEIFTLLQKRTIILQAEQRLSLLQQKNTILKQKSIQSQNTNFIQEQARNSLFLSLNGETRVLIATDTGIVHEDRQKTILPNWVQWLHSVHLCCGATIESGL